MNFDAIKTRKDFSILFRAIGAQFGVELGVSEGDFSEHCLKSYDGWACFFSIDRWGGDRGHDKNQFERTKNRLKRYGSSCVLRSSFSNSVGGFDNHKLDFIYIDGYAHEGQENGKTLYDWYPKLKKGGLFAGHDYHDDWPLTKIAVDKFCKDVGKNFNLTADDEYPSWFFIK